MSEHENNGKRHEVFDRYRGLMFSVAYGMLGEVAAAEDAIQDAFLRWQAMSEEQLEKVRSSKDYLAAAVTRICIDRMRSARSRREVYVGTWLPEPLVEEPAPVEEEVASRDALSVAVMVLLESLNPVERAVFILREVFGYDYGEVARIVGKSEANCRQISHRAKAAVTAHRPRFEASEKEREVLLESLVRAASDGEMERLLSLLSEDVVFYADGGGKVTAARNPIHGKDRVARFILGIVDKRQRRVAGGLPQSFTFRLERVNGEPGLVGYVDDEMVGVVAVEIEGGVARSIYMVSNPEKLSGVS